MPVVVAQSYHANPGDLRPRVGMSAAYLASASKEVWHLGHQRVRCIGMSTCTKSSFPSNRNRPGEDDPLLSKITTSPALVARKSIRYLTLKPISSGSPSTELGFNSLSFEPVSAETADTLIAGTSSALDTLRVIRLERLSRAKMWAALQDLIMLSAEKEALVVEPFGMI